MTFDQCAEHIVGWSSAPFTGLPAQRYSARPSGRVIEKAMTHEPRSRGFSPFGLSHDG